MFQGMEYVYEVYKEKSFSKAAKKMFISQPSLSATVKRVDEKVGYPIFDRSTKPLGLTELGRQYIQSVEQILSVQSDTGKALGQALHMLLPEKPILCLDGLHLPERAYLDVAAPIANGQVLPVVIKTLVL